MRRLGIGIFIMKILYLGALGKQRISLIKKEYCVGIFRSFKELGNIFLCLADVLADHLRKIDPV